MSRIEDFLNNLNGTEVEKTAEVVKTAEEQAAEAYFEKLANQNETVEAAAALSMIGEHLTKIAEDGQDELLMECGNGLLEASASMSIGLQKIASEDTAGMIIDMVETQDNLCKIASVLYQFATELEDEDFNKIAETTTEINNTLFDELNELAQHDESVAQYLSEYHGMDKQAGAKTEAVKETLSKGWGATKEAFKAPGRIVKGMENEQLMKRTANEGLGISKWQALKNQLGTEAGKSDAKQAALAYGGALAALGAAGYGAKKIHDKR